MIGLKLARLIISAIAITTVSFGCVNKQVKSSSATSQEKPRKTVQFICSKTYDKNSDQYVYSTVAWNPANKKPIVVWKRQDFSGNNYPPQARCEEVSPRFQQAYDSGSFKYITHGEMNEQPVICTSSAVGGDCQTLLITLKHEDNAERTLEQLSDILLGYASSALEQSSGGISYSEDNKLYVEVDVEDFLSQP
ncbi:COP23 domain-containing protein [Pleurocapsa sp. PCC 7319]|uniref:COP23 domain-containing protein n=1 Tax=Pleurocapsa sp. PCC 7319 TaxID=118161 RepID=UPI00034B7A51|nr:COP23 domain-containing protein [Pleurocapsa sp. PCC 7319]